MQHPLHHLLGNGSGFLKCAVFNLSLQYRKRQFPVFLDVFPADLDMARL